MNRPIDTAIRDLINRNPSLTDAQIKGLTFRFKKFKRAEIESLIDQYGGFAPTKAVKEEQLPIVNIPALGTIVLKDLVEAAPAPGAYDYRNFTYESISLPILDEPAWPTQHEEVSSQVLLDGDREFGSQHAMSLPTPAVDPMIRTKIARLYKLRFAQMPTDQDIEALRYDAVANPEGSVDHIGLELTQILIQL